MKTLIFNGSPRKFGNTASLIEELIKRLDGEVKVIRAYDCNIQPCNDCRFCWKNDGCSIQDEMQEVYDYIQECDNIVVAAPLQFSELAGQLLAVMSRLQTYWCARVFRGMQPVPKKKHGGVIIVRGGTGRLKKAEDTARTLLFDMNTTADVTVYVDRSDVIKSVDHPDAMEKIVEMAELFNKG